MQFLWYWNTKYNYGLVEYLSIYLVNAFSSLRRRRNRYRNIIVLVFFSFLLPSHLKINPSLPSYMLLSFVCRPLYFVVRNMKTSIGVFHVAPLTKADVTE